MSQPRSASEYWRQRRERERRLPRRPAPLPITERYCFCRDTPLWADRCSKCGRPPYTD